MPVQRIQMRRGTSIEWAADNPVLRSGEFGYDMTVREVKIGDGATTWDDLPWLYDVDALSAAYLDDENSQTYAAIMAGFMRGQVVTHPRWGADPTGADESATAIQGAIEWVEANGGLLYYPAGIYKISTKLRHKIGIKVRCDGWGDVTSTAAPINPKTRLAWYGAADEKMIEVRAATVGDTVYGMDWKGPHLMGRNIAGYGLFAASCRYSHFDVRGERVTKTLWWNDDSNDALWADNTSDFFFYDCGATAAAENSHGFVLWNSSGHSGYQGAGPTPDPLNLGCTNFTGGVMITNTKNGDGIRIGDTDACYIKKTHHVRKAGGTGKGVRFCNTEGVILNPGAASGGVRADGMKSQPRVARKIVIGYVVGGIIHGESGTGPNVCLEVNSESTSYEGTMAATHYRVMDRVHGDMFRTHEYVMSAVRPCPIGLGSGSATGLGTLGGIGVQVVNFAAASTGAWNFMLPAPEDWANGRLTGIKILHGGAVGDTVNTGVVVTVAAKMLSAGTALGSGATTKTVTLTGPAANNTLPNETTILFDSPVAYTRGQHLHLAISRIGGDAADTFPNAWSLATVQLLYTSDGPDSDGADRFEIPLPYLS